MSGKRTRGQETEVVMVQDGEPLLTLTDVTGFSSTFDKEIQEEKFVGEVANRFDSIFNGCSGKMDMQVSTEDYFKLIERDVAKAQARVRTGVVTNIKQTYVMPSGRRVTISFLDVEFGEWPIDTGGRTEYVKVSATWKCSRARFLGLS